MKTIYLQSAIEDIEWLSTYYDSIFPQGKSNMRSQVYTTEMLMEEHPHIGKQLLSHPKLRTMQIPKTPFTFIYRVTETHIEILRVWDQRRDPVSLNFDL